MSKISTTTNNKSKTKPATNKKITKLPKKATKNTKITKNNKTKTAQENSKILADKIDNNQKIKKPVAQNTNAFVDKYLEFYDDIKIPSRRYDW